MKATLEHFPVKPYQNTSLHIQSDLSKKVNGFDDNSFCYYIFLSKITVLKENMHSVIYVKLCMK